jgi:pyruvate kinase
MTLPLHKTKIVATVGPASSSKPVLEKMILAGMNVARLNFSHGDFADHRQAIENIRAASQTTGRPMAIMADLPGPKIRIGTLDPDRVELNAGDRFTLTTDSIVGDHTRASISFAQLPHVVKRGDVLSLNDGYIQLEVAEVRGVEVSCAIVVGGELRSRKGVNLPGIDLGIRAFTARDRECLKFALEHGVDAVSQSFVENAEDVRVVREAAAELGYAPFVIAKIERSRALERLDEILDATDGVMIARGDLGVEVPIERIALVQKDIMRRANQRAKPVITATHMLESMSIHRLPTRAEATDVSNAILDGTDCLMLSGESATGDFPVESVGMLSRIAATVEAVRRHIAVKEMFAGIDLTGRIRPMHLVLVSVEAGLDYLKPAAIFMRAIDGSFVRRLAALRLPVWTVALCSAAKTEQDLLFSSGVVPVRAQVESASWDGHVKQYIQQHQLPGQFAILIEGPSADDPTRNFRMEIIDV